MSSYGDAGVARALQLYRPASAALLGLCLKDDCRREGLLLYTADTLWLLLKWFAREQLDFPSYGEAIRRSAAQGRELSAEEIKQFILEKLR